MGPRLRRRRGTIVNDKLRPSEDFQQATAEAASDPSGCVGTASSRRNGSGSEEAGRSRCWCRGQELSQALPLQNPVLQMLLKMRAAERVTFLFSNNKAEAVVVRWQCISVGAPAATLELDSHATDISPSSRLKPQQEIGPNNSASSRRSSTV